MRRGTSRGGAGRPGHGGAGHDGDGHDGDGAARMRARGRGHGSGSVLSWFRALRMGGGACSDGGTSGPCSEGILPGLRTRGENLSVDYLTIAVGHRPLHCGCVSEQRGTKRAADARNRGPGPYSGVSRFGHVSSSGVLGRFDDFANWLRGFSWKEEASLVCGEVGERFELAERYERAGAAGSMCEDRETKEDKESNWSNERLDSPLRRRDGVAELLLAITHGLLSRPPCVAVLVQQPRGNHVTACLFHVSLEAPRAVIGLLVVPLQPRGGRPVEDMPQRLDEDQVGDEDSDEQGPPRFDHRDLAEVLRVDGRGRDGQRPERGGEFVVAGARRPRLQPGRLHGAGVVGQVVEVGVALQEGRVVEDVATVGFAQVGEDDGVEDLGEGGGGGPDVGPRARRGSRAEIVAVGEDEGAVAEEEVPADVEEVEAVEVADVGGLEGCGNR